MGGRLQNLLIQEGNLSDAYIIGGFKLPNALIVPGPLNFNATSTTDLYTVPPGRKALFNGNTLVTGGGAVSNYIAVKKAGQSIYFRMAAASGWQAAGVTGLAGQATVFVMDAGDTLAAVTNGTGGLAGSFYPILIEFDASSPITPFFCDLTNVPVNTPVPLIPALPTIPTPKRILFLNQLLQLALTSSGNNTIANGLQSSGGTATLLMIRNGTFSLDVAANAIANSASIAQPPSATLRVWTAFGSGDQLTIQSNVAGAQQYVWGTYVLLP